jgi:dTDP-4-amino-4,6-dideoxygalactose transaminase
VDEIRKIANHYEIPILEDSAEALGSHYKGTMCGTFGDISALSFNGNKIITTSGGGALVSKKETIKEKAIFLATQARDAAPHYQHSHVGYNYRLSNISAGIGRGQMEVLQKHINLRREMHDFYMNLFKNIKEVTVFQEPNSDYYSNHWLSCITINSSENGKTSEQLRLALENDNIESRPLWKPMHLQPIFEKYPYYGNTVSENLFNNGLCLPSGSNLNNDDKQRIIETVSRFFMK